MIRAFLYILVVVALAIAASWLAELPGSFRLTVAGLEFEASLLVAFVLLLVVIAAVMILWSLLAMLFQSPAAVSGFFRARRRDKGYRALTRGMVAAAAGDVRLAKHYGSEARRLAPHEPLSLLLRAQAAQLGGDRPAARRAFETMLERTDTEVLGLRGLYIEASRDGDHEAARRYAEEAARRAPSLPWAGNALLDYQTREGDWDGALATVKRNADARLVDRKAAARQRAVLLTAKAQSIEDEDEDRALALAVEAHRLAPDLVPAAVLAGRLSAAAGSTRQAVKIVERTWKDHPHPDLAEVYAHARPGDSARDRLKRVRALADKRPFEREGAIAVAVVAIEAREWTAAREALQPLLREHPTRRVCILMAEIEEGEHGNAGKVREWLSRALRAPRDPAWVADGFVSEEWLPVSPVSGELDAFEWRTPPELLASATEEPSDRAALTALEERAPLPSDAAPPAIAATTGPAAPAAAVPPLPAAPERDEVKPKDDRPTPPTDAAPAARDEAAIAPKVAPAPATPPKAAQPESAPAAPPPPPRPEATGIVARPTPAAPAKDQGTIAPTAAPAVATGDAGSSDDEEAPRRPPDDPGPDGDVEDVDVPARRAPLL